MRPRPLLGLAVAVAVAHLIAVIVSPGSSATGWLINAAFVAGALLCLWRAASLRSDRAAWVCVGVGLLCQAFGDRYYKLFLADAVYVTQPSVADFGYLAFYPLAGAAVALMLRPRLKSMSRALILDAVVGALAVVAIVAALVFPHVLTTSGGDLAAVVTNLAYPICDLVLLGMLVGGAQMLRGWGGRGLLLIAVALTLFVFADVVYLYRTATGSYELGGPLDACWSVAAVAIGLAAWQPDTRQRRHSSNSTARTLITVVGAALLATALLVFDHYHRTTSVALYLSAVTILGALARLAVTLTGQQRSASALAETDETLRNVTETIDEVFWVATADEGRLLYVNPTYERLYGRPVSELYEDPLSWLEAVHPEDRAGVRSELARVPEAGQIGQDFRIVRPDGGIRNVRARTYFVPAVNGGSDRLVGTTADITVEHDARAQLAASEVRYRELALHDPLTGLANRGLFNDRLKHLLARRAPADATTVVMIDVDGFKGINDALGHGAGDELLTAVARRLEACTRPEDTVARLGGDEFSVLITSVDPEGAAECGQRIATALRRPYELTGRVVECSASVGVATHSSPNEPEEALLLRADVALYQAKAAGGARCVAYDAELEAGTQLQRALSADLSIALAERQIVAHYQPICELASGRIVAFEALVRWQHPTRGLLGPDAFLGLATQSGAITAIGHFVLDEATRAAALWNAACDGAAGVSVHVNLSAPELAETGVVDAIARTLKHSAFDPHRLVIEVTEQTLVADIERAKATLARIRGLGVRIALDDFGAGYSALGYLRDLPAFSILKIDRRLVGGEDPRERAIFESAIALGHSLSMDVVAEGIENTELQALAVELGCDVGQGWLFGRPADAATAGSLLASPPSVSLGSADAPGSARGEVPVADPKAATLVPSRTIVVIDDQLARLERFGTELGRCGYQPRLALTAEEGERLISSERPELVLIHLDMSGIDGPETARAIKRRPELRDIPLLAFGTTPLDECRSGTASRWFDGELDNPPGTSRSALTRQIERTIAERARPTAA